jgi:hypothetical protein
MLRCTIYTTASEQVFSSQMSEVSLSHLIAPGKYANEATWTQLRLIDNQDNIPDIGLINNYNLILIDHLAFKCGRT